MAPVRVSSTMVKSAGVKLGCGRLDRSRLQAAMAPLGSPSPSWWMVALKAASSLGVLDAAVSQHQPVA